MDDEITLKSPCMRRGRKKIDASAKKIGTSKSVGGYLRCAVPHSAKTTREPWSKPYRCTSTLSAMKLEHGKHLQTEMSQESIDTGLEHYLST